MAIPKPRHLDRRNRQFYRLLRSGETPHFAVAVAIAFAVAFLVVTPKELSLSEVEGDLLLLFFMHLQLR